MNRQIITMKNTTRIIGLLYLVIIMSACERNLKQVDGLQDIPFPQGDRAILPHLTSNDGKLYLSWVDSLTGSSTRLLYSSLQDGRWLEPTVLTTGENWFVNWADYPMIAAHDGHILSHYLQQTATGKMAYGIQYNVSTANGKQNGTYQPLNNDHTDTEHGFVSMIPYRDSSFLVAWLDGRNMEGADHGHGGHHGGTMSVRAAEVTASGDVIDEQILDASACTCCQTTASMTSNGPVVLYRDCTEDNIRDIVIVRKVGDVWTKPIPIYADNWFIQGCPVNGPKSAAVDNTLAVAWFTAADDNPRVQLIFSNNGGEKFNAPILISNKEVLGRVDVSLIDSTQAVVSWMQSKGQETFLYAMKVNVNGKKGPIRQIAALSSSRKTGFPQMEIFDGQLYFAWMSVHDNGTLLKTAAMAITDF
ncbi:hypothetical protein [Sphingobacterium faecium]|uniref:hypothetical protein n=1 Tax=Sphingobacterium faecium TaxID=34087 RepID=UPI002468558B|nr:hypothetical protein [Sphingobacterium faecium]MDH5826642.1 hypothetical protein [Sphingobacterium faecium]